MKSIKKQLVERLKFRRGDGLYEVNDVLCFLENMKPYSLTKDFFLSKIVWKSEDEQKEIIEKSNEIMKKRTNNDKLEFLELSFLKDYFSQDGNNMMIIAEKEYYNLPIYGVEKISGFIPTAQFYKPKDIFNFDCKKELCLSNIVINDDYLNNFVNKTDSGFILESHDFSHLFISTKPDNSGFLVLGKRDIKNNSIQLVGFKIPFGYAIYIPEFVIHSDAYLVGEYRVAFTAANNLINYQFEKKIKFVPSFL